MCCPLRWCRRAVNCGGSSHGLQNQAEGFFAARLLGPGVCVGMHGQVLAASQTRKDKDRGTLLAA
jgi:hypothetical protein